MISVLLILLKILGIILLSLIGIVIVLLLLVLFVPIRYRFKGYYKDEFVCHGKITWLFHLLSVSIHFEKELITSVKILGIPLTRFQKKKSVTLPDTSKEVLTEHENIEETAEEHAEAKETADENSTVEETSCGNAMAEEIADNNKTEKISLFEKIKQYIQKLIQKILGFWNKILSLIQNIRTKKDTVQHYIEILRREEVKQAFSLCKKSIFKLVKHILPKKMKVSAKLGFDDPSTTGYILAIYGMLPASVGKKIKLYPDFDHSILECDFLLKGSVNAWSMLHQLLCIVSDKNCRALYHIVKKEILNER